MNNNFTPNTQSLAGRIQIQQQQQQVHQPPVTSGVAIPQAANMQKNNLQSTAFPINQQAANMAQKSEEKSQIPPPTTAHQMHQAAQNNNNHGIAILPPVIPQQLINAQHQASMNRSVNITTQSFQQSSQILLPSISHQGVAKVGNVFQHMQQMINHPNHPMNLVPQSQASSVPYMFNQQTNLQKLQATVPPAVHQIKPVQHPQGGKLGTSHAPSSVSQQNMQYSPPKPNHPQMKTTAKLASPGSQLQTLQKSPSAPNPPPIGPQASLQNVPSTPAVSSAAPAPSLSVTTAAVTISPAKAPAQISPAKQPQPLPPLSTLQTPTQVSPATSVVPSAATSQSPAKAVAVASVTDPAPTKAVDQQKESLQTIPIQSKPVPKLEEKKVAAPTTNNTATVPATAVDTNNTKVEKVASAAPEKPQAVVATPPKPAATPSKNTMRLATVTPARQKKPPATNNKKPVPAPVAAAPTPSVPKSPVKPVIAPLAAAKLVETPKSSAKKPQATAVASPKSNPTPSTSSAQSNASSNSTTSPKTKRSRVKVQPYQSPTPELALVTKLSKQTANANNKNGNEEKLKLFYKDEFLAVRNLEGTYYLCQTLQNVYKGTGKIRIHWLNEKVEGKVNEEGSRTFSFDYQDMTEFDAVLTTVSLDKVNAKTYELSKEEQARIESILKKAIDVQNGIVPRPTVTEENPDGLDLSLFNDEAQLDKISPNKRKRGVKSDDEDDDEDGDGDYEETPRKKKNLKKSPTVRSSRVVPAKKTATYEEDSSESDEENLMEIKKKANKKQATKLDKPSTSKASEPQPSTSKAAMASLLTPVKGRKRVGRAVEEVSAKISKTIEKMEPLKESPAAKAPAAKTKPPAKPKAVKKSVPEKALPVVDDIKPSPEKKTVAEKRPAAKKAPVVEEKPSEAKLVETPKATPAKAIPEKAAAKTTPAKKKAPAAKASPITPTDQPSTSRSRNTRSKK